MRAANELLKSLIDFIEALPEFAAVHVGSEIPDFTKFESGVCYLEQASETEHPALDCDENHGVTFNVEIAHDKIAEAKKLAEALKRAIRAFASYTAPLGDVQYLQLADAGGEYAILSAAGDRRVMIEGLVLNLWG